MAYEQVKYFPQFHKEFSRNRPAPDYKKIHPKTRKAWRQWLAKVHAKSPGIWLIYYEKESGKYRLPYDEAVEEALCLGWIDSLPAKLDASLAGILYGRCWILD